MRKPSVTILHHFFHPDDVVGARQFSDFAQELSSRGWQVTVLTSNRHWACRKKKIPTPCETWNGVHIIRVPRFGWNQAHDLLRIGNSLWMMIGWLMRLRKLPHTDVVVIGSDPQFSQLLLPAIKCLFKPRILVYWCFDLFPEAILADGAHGPIRWGAELMRYLVKQTYRSVDLMADLGPCMRVRLDAHNHSARRETFTPWALIEPEAPVQPDPSVRRALFGDADLTLLYSGNMGKAHEFSGFLHLARVLNRINPKIVFCFACRGNRMDELKQAITPRDTNVRLAPFTEEANLGKQLGAADLHLLSLRPEWAGTVVPSKFFGSLAVGKPVLYAGPRDSSIAKWIQELDVGMVLTENNFRVVCEQVLKIAKDPRKLAAWQTNAFEAYQQHFAKKVIMDSWNSVLREQLHSHLQKSSAKITSIYSPKQQPGTNEAARV